MYFPRYHVIVSGIVNRPARDSTGRIDAYLGARIKERRQKVGATQEALAAAMKSRGCPTWAPATVAAIETGRRNLSLTELGNLCVILGVNLKTLVGDDDEADLDHRLWALVEDVQRSDPPLLKSGPADAAIRRRQQVRLEDAVLEKVTGRTHSELLGEGWRDQVLLAIEEHYGRDLLAERDQRVADGQGTKTWVSRRLSDEVAEIPGVIELVALFNMKGEGR